MTKQASNHTVKPAIVRLVWNGCDNYIECDRAAREGYNFDGEKLYCGASEFTPFDAQEIVADHRWIDEEEMDGVLGTTSGKYYIAI
jgi:hypothetical protein